jgi:hypothetical protein
MKWIAASLGLIALAAALLLAPALIWSRPFIFYDTPVYWGWGRDVVEALQHPRPRVGQPWIDGRPLNGWELGAHGASQGDLRFTLSAIAARSPFYAVSLYLLTGIGGLWLVVGLQAMAVAWTLRAALLALVPGCGAVAYLAVVGALTALTSIGFETGYAMPDVFGGIALVAALVLALRPDRLGIATKIGFVGLMTFAVLAHTANALDLMAALGFGIVALWRLGLGASIRRMIPIGVALAGAFALAALSHGWLAAAFGRPPMTAPFLASRILADGVGQQYLRGACAREALAACDLAHVQTDYPEYYLALYPLEPPPSLAAAAHVYDQLQFRHVGESEATHRERFVAEQPRLVLGAALNDGPRMVAAMLAYGAREVFNVAVERDFDSLSGLLAERTQRRGETIAITPGAADCERGGGRSCGALQLGSLVTLQRLVVWASLAYVVAARLVAREEDRGDLADFAALAISVVLANAFLCGALSGPYDRYQSRVAWLIPFAAALLVIDWARRRSSSQSATLPSPVASIVTPPSARAHP